MSSKKPRDKSKLRKPSLIEYSILFIIIGIILLIGIIVAINPPSFTPRLYFVAVKTITIRDYWVGYSPVAPIEANYQLSLEGSVLNGTAQFAVGSFSANRPSQQDTVNISIPADITLAFLGKLKESVLVEGVYPPRVERTDDYPSISITIETRREAIEIFTESQGREHIPWGVRMRENTYVVDSAIPAQALAILDPYLRQDVLREMIIVEMSRSYNVDN